MSVFSLFADFTSERRAVVLFKSISGNEYTYTFHCHYYNGSISSVNKARGSSLCVGLLDGHVSVGICFYDCDDPSDIMLLPSEDPDPLPIYSQSRNLNLDDEANPTKVRFDRPVRKLELD